MRFLSRRWMLLAAAASTVWGSFLHDGLAQDGVAPIENLRIPLEHFEDGTVKTQLRAGQAWIEQHGPILASNVVFELFGADGSREGTITAEACRYDRDRGIAESDSKLKIERAGLVITGKGFEWNGDQERVTIHSDVRVVLFRDLTRTRGMVGMDRKDVVRE